MGLARSCSDLTHVHIQRDNQILSHTPCLQIVQEKPDFLVTTSRCLLLSYLSACSEKSSPMQSVDPRLHHKVPKTKLCDAASCLPVIALSCIPEVFSQNTEQAIARAQPPASCD
jgi:hypothetical protein